MSASCSATSAAFAAHGNNQSASFSPSRQLGPTGAPDWLLAEAERTCGHLDGVDVGAVPEVCSRPIGGQRVRVDQTGRERERNETKGNFLASRNTLASRRLLTLASASLERRDLATLVVIRSADQHLDRLVLGELLTRSWRSSGPCWGSRAASGSRWAGSGASGSAAGSPPDSFLLGAAKNSELRCRAAACGGAEEASSSPISVTALEEGWTCRPGPS